MSELVLDSCVARYRRAEEHMQTIENEIGEWKKTAPYRFVSQANAERTRFSMLIRVRNPPALLRWSLILSDAVNGLRCSLDHLIHAIAIKQDALASTDRQNPDRLAFPICSSHEIFLKAKHRLAGLSDAVRTEIQRVQPYNRIHRHLPPLLGLLHKIDNINKHQLLQIAMSIANGGEIRNLNPAIRAGRQCRVEVSTAEVVDGAEVVAVVFTEPTADVTYQFDGQISIALAIDRAPNSEIRWVGVNLLLAEAADEVWRIINQVAAVA